MSTTSLAAPAADLGRDMRVTALVSVAHGLSHFYQLAMPPLFFLMKDPLGVGYTELGLMMTVFYSASGVAQTVAGFLVDRFGATRILLGGLACLAGAVMLAGLAPSFWLLLPLAALAGMGNSVFHPADFSILNATVSQGRLGRAFSIHGVCGNLGWALASAASLGLGLWLGWRAALLVLGAGGLVAVLLLASQARLLSARPAAGQRSKATPPEAGLAALFAAAILMCFAYFVLLAMALIGVQTMGIDTLMQIYGVSYELAAAGLTAFLLGSAAGTLSGGVLADRTSRHAAVAGGGMALGAAFTLLLAGAVVSVGAILPLLALTGFCLGVTNPSRDMLVRAATPPGATGKVFGFVYSGLDLGSSVAPLLLGILLDRHQPQLLLAAMAALMLLTILTIVGVRGQAQPRPA